MSKLKVLIVSNLFPTPAQPERGVFTYQLAKALSEYCDVEVSCPLPWVPSWNIFRSHPDWKFFVDIPEKATMNGITIHYPRYILLPKVSEKIHASLMSLGIKRHLNRLVREKEIDVINVHWIYPDTVAVINACSDTIPVIPTALGSDINVHLQDKNKEAQIISALTKASCITVVSENLRDELVLKGLNENKIDVIHNGVNADKFKQLDQGDALKSLGKPLSEDFHIVFVGRLSSEKRIDLLIKAAHQLKEKNIKTTISVIGAGPLETQLKSMVSNLGLDHTVHFIGQESHERVSLWINSADVLCLPSDMEGCPNVVLESLSTGIPVIGSKVGAMPYIINENLGVLFEPGDANDLERAILEARNKEWNRSLIAESMKSNSWSSVAKKYITSYTQN